MGWMLYFYRNETVFTSPGGDYDLKCRIEGRNLESRVQEEFNGGATTQRDYLNEGCCLQFQGWYYRDFTFLGIFWGDGPMAITWGPPTWVLENLDSLHLVTLFFTNYLNRRLGIVPDRSATKGRIQSLAEEREQGFFDLQITPSRDTVPCLRNEKIVERLPDNPTDKQLVGLPTCGALWHV